MKNWITIFLIFVIPLGLYGYLDCRAKEKPDVVKENIAALEKEIKKEVKPVAGDLQTKMQDKPTFYKFSSPMCGDCIKLARELEPIKPKFAGKIYFKDMNVSGAAGDDPLTKSMIETYKITMVPTVIIIDKNGKFLKKIEGYKNQSSIENDIKEAIGE